MKLTQKWLQRLPAIKKISPYLVLGIILFFHLFGLTTVPNGLYIDEYSIADSAAHLATNWHDEQGRFLPLFVQNNGDYKQPVFVYSVAILFKIFGVSTLVLKLTSVFYFMASLIVFYLILQKLFKDPRVQLFGLLLFGFLPQYWLMSREAFEVVSAIFFTVLSTYFLFQTFEWNMHKLFAVRARFAALSGVSLGLLVYAYSTTRVFAALLILIAALLYSKKYWREILIIGASFGILLLPLIPILLGSDALTNRFDMISYLGNTYGYSPVEKLMIGITEFSKYWSTEYLIIRGDSNLRHGSGWGGILTSTGLFLVLIGLTGSFLKRRSLDDLRTMNQLNKSPNIRIFWFVILSAIAAVIPAALTFEGTPHALRSVALGFYLVLIALYGLNTLLQLNKQFLYRTLQVLLVLEISLYVIFYFSFYPAKAYGSFATPNLDKGISQAVNNGCKKIQIKQYGTDQYLLDFYSRAHQVVVLDNDQAVPDNCVVTNNLNLGL